MSKVENKTKATKASVTKFIDSIKDPQRKADAKVLVKLLREVSGEKPVMWGETGAGPRRKAGASAGEGGGGRAKSQQRFMRGPAIVGFGSYHYKYASGHEGDASLIGFSPRAQAMTIYIVPGFHKYATLLQRLGKFKTSVSCLYIKKLSDVHLPTLKELIKASMRDMREKYE